MKRRKKGIWRITEYSYHNNHNITSRQKADLGHCYSYGIGTSVNEKIGI